MKLICALLGTFILCLVNVAQASQSTDVERLTISRNQEPTSLTTKLRLLEDPTGQLTFNQLQSPGYQAKLRPWTKSSANFGFSRSAYWVAFTLQNPTDQPIPLLIRQDYLLIDYLDFWAKDISGEWQKRSTGDRLPFSSRGLPLRDFAFPVTLPAHSERTFYLRFASEGSLNIGLSVSSETAFLPKLAIEQLMLGVYYGGFLVLVIYNLFLFIAVRERAFIYYMLYALSYGHYFGVHNGLTFQFFWPDNPWLANESLPVLLGMSLIFATQFAREVCSSRQLAPRTDTLARILLHVMVPLTLIAPFYSYRIMILIFAQLTLLVCVTLLILGTISFLRGSSSARYFMLAWVTLLGSVIIYMFKTFGWLPHTALTQNAFQVGALIEMVLLSLALGAQVREINKRGYIDELSQLHNRRHFDEQLPREFNLAARTGSPLSLLVLDLDHFKVINDRFGHKRGDLTIHAIGDLILKQVRKPMLACRYGGEEFAILLPRTNEEQATALANRLVQKVAELKIEDMPITTSIGVAGMEQNNFGSATQLFEAADAALYLAKQRGRNRVVVSEAASSQPKANEEKFA